MSDITSAIYGADPNSIPKPPNPVTVFQDWQNLANSRLQNKLGQAQLTGNIISNQQATQDLKTKQSNRVAQQTFGLLTLPDDQLKSATLKTLQQELATGTIDQNTYSTWLSNLPSAEAPVGQWRAAITAHLIGTMSGPEAVNSVIGVPSAMNTGGNVLSGMVGGPLSRNPGSFTPSSSTPNTLSPSELDNPTMQDVDPATGQVRMVSPREYYTRRGQVPPTAPGIQPPTTQLRPGAAPTPGQATPGTAGGVPPRLPTAQPQAAPGGAPVISNLGPADTAALTAGGAKYVADREASSSYPQRLYPYEQAYELLPSVATGVASALPNEVKSFIIANLPKGTVDIDEVKQATYDKLHKYLEQIVTNNPLTASSDSRMAAVLNSNPNMNLAQGANIDVMKSLIGLERLKQAAFLSYQATGGNPAGYADYLSKFMTTADPRAYFTDMLDDNQHTRLKDALGHSTPQQIKNFKDSFALANKYGLLNLQPPPPGTPSATPK